MDTCTPPEQYFICTNNGYSGCCGENPCDQSEATCTYSITTTEALEVNIVTADISPSSSDSAEMEDPSTPDPTTFNIAVISAPSSLTGVLTSLVTATAWTPAAVSTTNTLFGGALSQISVTEGVVLQFSTVLSPVATEPVTATGTSPGGVSGGITTTSSLASSPSAAIAGGVVASIVAALLISVLICWLRMHRRKRRSRYQKKEETDIVVPTLFDVPPSELLGDSRATSTEISEKHKTGGGILGFINRRLTVGGKADAATTSTEKRHTTSDSAETDVAFKPVAASVAIEERQTTSSIADVVPKNIDRRHTKSEANPVFNPMAATIVTEKRQTIGGMATMAPKSTDRQHTISDKAETNTAYDPTAASEAIEERRTTGGKSSAAFNIADANPISKTRAASEVATKRHTIGSIAEVTPEVNKWRHPAHLKVETNFDIKNKRHTIGSVARAASEVANKRRTTG